MYPSPGLFWRFNESVHISHSELQHTLEVVDKSIIIVIFAWIPSPANLVCMSQNLHPFANNSRGENQT